MLRYALGRVFQTIPTLFILSLVVFSLIRLAPGDPAELRMGREASKPENKPRLEALRREMGLDLPIPVQYLVWLKNGVGGDLGVSIKTSRPATELVLSKIPASLELVAGAAVFALLVSFPVGIAAAMRRGSLVDRLAMAFVPGSGHP
jgi:peptide/nickel transport system permease protein